MGAHVEGVSKGDSIDIYRLLQDFETTANGFISFAQKGTDIFFIKERLHPLI